MEDDKENRGLQSNVARVQTEKLGSSTIATNSLPSDETKSFESSSSSLSRGHVFVEATPTCPLKRIRPLISPMQNSTKETAAAEFLLLRIADIVEEQIDPPNVQHLYSYQTHEENPLHIAMVVHGCTIDIVHTKCDSQGVSPDLSFHTTIELTHPICCGSTGSRSNCVLFGDIKNSIHLITFDGEVLFSYSLSKYCLQRNSSATLKAIELLPEDKVLFLFKDGYVIELSSLCIHRLANAKKLNHPEELRRALVNMTLSQSSLWTPQSEGRQIMAYYGSEFALAVLSNDLIEIYDAKNLQRKSCVRCNLVGESIKQMQFSPCGRFLMIVNEAGTLSMWDAKDFIFVTDFSDYSFQSVAIISSRKDEHLRLLAIVGSGEDNGVFLKVLDIDNLKIHEFYSISCSRNTVFNLASNSSRHTTLAYILEPTHSHGSESRLSIFLETIPQQRYKSLVAAGSFDEAQAVAIELGMDLAPFHQAKLRYFLDTIDAAVKQQCYITSDFFHPQNDNGKWFELSPIGKRFFRESFEAVIDDGRDNLNEIIEWCLSALLPTHDDSLFLLQTMETKLTETAHKISLETIVLVMWRFWTYLLISDPTLAFDASRWQRFRKSDLSSELSNYLAFGSIRAAITIWHRHKSPCITTGIISGLQGLPQEVPPNTYCSWLKNDVVPELSPIQSRELSMWLHSRAFCAANVGRIADAIELTCVMVEKVVHTDQQTRILFRTHCTSDANASFAQKLHVLHSQLQEMNYLFRSHDFPISLSAYLESTPSSICMAMLDRVSSPEMVQDEVRKIEKYLSLCEGKISGVLLEYVLELCEDIQSGGLMEEHRIIEVVKCIDSEAMRGDAALQFFRSVHAPYSKAVKDFAEETLLWETPKQEELREQKRLMDLQDMFSRYGLKQFNLADILQAKRLLSHITAQIDNPKSLDDAMHLVSAYNSLSRSRAVLDFLQNIIVSSDSLNRITRIQSILATEELLLSPETFDELMYFCMSILEYGAYTRETQQLAAELIEHMATMSIRRGVSLGGCSLDYRIVLRDIRRIRRLQADDHVFISLRTLENPEACLALVESEVDAILKDWPTDTVGPTMKGNKVNGKGQNGKGRATIVSEKRGDYQANFQTTNQPLPICREESKRYEEDEDGEHRSRKSKSNGSGDSRSSTSSRCSRSRSSTNFLPIYRMSKHLGITSTVVRSVIVQRAVKKGLLGEALRSSRELVMRSIPGARLGPNGLEDENDYAASLYAVATAISMSCATPLVQPERGYEYESSFSALVVKGFREAWELLSMALTICNDANVSDTCHSFRMLDFVRLVLSQTQASLEWKEVFVDETPSKLTWSSESRSGSGVGGSMVLNSCSALQHVSGFMAEEHIRRCSLTKHTSFTKSKQLVTFLTENDGNWAALTSLLSMTSLSSDGVVAVEEQISILAQRALQSAQIDSDLILGLILSMDQCRAFDAFRQQLTRETIYRDFERLQKLATIGCDAARAWEEIAFLHHCTELEGNARWWHHFSLLGIECDHKAFSSERKDIAYIRRLVPKLLKNSNMDLYTTLEFSHHYNIEDSYPLLVYVESLLLQDSRKAGNDQEYKDLIIGVLDDIHEKELVSLLVTTIPRVDGQDYDRLEFIMKLLLKTNYKDDDQARRSIDVIHVLKDYKSRVTLRDRNRVSFHELMKKPWGVLEQELTNDTVPHLVLLSGPLKLDPDEFYMHLIKTMVEEHTKSADVVVVKGLEADVKKGQTATQVVFNPPFSTFRVLITSIRNLENAVTTAEWISEKYTSHGDHKLEALQLALQLAQRWEQPLPQQLPDEVGSMNEGDTNASHQCSFTGLEAVSRLKKKICRLNTERMLARVGGDMSALTPYIDRPQELFLQLYSRFSLSTDMTGIVVDKSVVHKVADEIALFYSLPSLRLRKYLVSQWLTERAMPSSAREQDEVEGNGSIFREDEYERKQRIDSEYAERIAFMCTYHTTFSSTDQDSASVNSELETASFLMKYAQQAKSTVPFRARSRALEAILHFASEDVIVSLYPLGVRALRETLKMYRHMVEFEESRIPKTLSQFQNCDKEGLVRGLWRDYQNNPRILRLVSLIMLDYGIYDSGLWTELLLQLASMKMYRFLLTLLDRIPIEVTQTIASSVSNVWSAVLEQPFRELSARMTSQQVNTHVPAHDDNDDGSSSSSRGGPSRKRRRNPAADRVDDATSVSPGRSHGGHHHPRRRRHDDDGDDCDSENGDDDGEDHDGSSSSSSLFLLHGGGGGWDDEDVHGVVLPVLESLVGLLRKCPFVSSSSASSSLSLPSASSALSSSPPPSWLGGGRDGGGGSGPSSFLRDVVSGPPAVHPLAVRCVLTIASPRLRRRALRGLLGRGWALPLLEQVAAALFLPAAGEGGGEGPVGVVAAPGTTTLTTTTTYDDGDLAIAQSVFEWVLSTRAFHTLHGSAFEDAFKEFVVGVNEAQPLIQYLLENDRHEEAKELAEMSHSVHPLPNADGKKDWELLEAFMAQHPETNNKAVLVEEGRSPKSSL